MAGDTLCEARKLHRNRGIWQVWVRENFEGSYETAKVYVRVARQWNEPDVKEAREAGDITSLNTFLSFTTKARALLANGPEPPEVTEAGELR